MKDQKLSQIYLFKGKRIRRSFYGNECWFSIIDIIEILTESPRPSQYWAKLKTRKFNNFEEFPFWEPLKLVAIDGKIRETDCANTEGIFIIIQFIPSPKAEEMKRFLAEFAYEKIQDIENEELIEKRRIMLCELRGYEE